MSHPLTTCISEIELLQERIAEKNDRIEALEVALIAEVAARDNRIEALEFELKAAKSEIEIADSVIEQKHARIEALEADFNSAAAAASEYSEFWEQRHGDFDQFGNYVPYSQMDGDLRAAKSRIEALEAALREIAGQMLIDEHDEDYNGDYEAGYEALVRIARAALVPEQDK